MTRLLPKDQINFQEVSNEDLWEFQTSDYYTLAYIIAILIIYIYTYKLICYLCHLYISSRLFLYIFVDWLWLHGIMHTHLGYMMMYTIWIPRVCHHLKPQGEGLHVLTWWNIFTDCIFVDKDRKTQPIKKVKTHTHIIYDHTIRWWGQYVFFRKLPNKYPPKTVFDTIFVYFCKSVLVNSSIKQHRFLAFSHHDFLSTNLRLPLAAVLCGSSHCHSPGPVTWGQWLATGGDAAGVLNTIFWSNIAVTVTPVIFFKALVLFKDIHASIYT